MAVFDRVLGDTKLATLKHPADFHVPHTNPTDLFRFLYSVRPDNVYYRPEEMKTFLLAMKWNRYVKGDGFPVTPLSISNWLIYFALCL